MQPNEKPVIIEVTCTEVRTLCADYFDGDLQLEGYIRLDAHLQRCPHCAAIYNGVRNVIELLACNELFPVPDGLDECIYNAVIGSRGTHSN